MCTVMSIPEGTLFTARVSLIVNDRIRTLNFPEAQSGISYCYNSHENSGARVDW